jgi:hypothetical protein
MPRVKEVLDDERVAAAAAGIMAKGKYHLHDGLMQLLWLDQISSSVAG